MKIGTTIKVDTGNLIITSLPNKINNYYILKYSSYLEKYNNTIEMSEQSLKDLISIKNEKRA